METKPKNFEVNNLKGKAGEELCGLFLIKEGWIVQTNINQNQAHVVDFTIFRFKPGTNEMMFAEIKSKAARTHYPDTGFNIHQCNTYLELCKKSNSRCLIMFVDEHSGECYGNFLDVLMLPHVDKLKRPYPLIESSRFDKEIIYFSIESMNHFFYLDDANVSELKKLSNRCWEYKDEEFVVDGE